jgi:hypothetical protein
LLARSHEFKLLKCEMGPCKVIIMTSMTP